MSDQRTQNTQTFPILPTPLRKRSSKVTGYFVTSWDLDPKRRNQHRTTFFLRIGAQSLGPKGLLTPQGHTWVSGKQRPAQKQQGPDMWACMAQVAFLGSDSGSHFSEWSRLGVGPEEPSRATCNKWGEGDAWRNICSKGKRPLGLSSLDSAPSWAPLWLGLQGATP